MSAPLIQHSWRRAAVVAIGLGALVATVLGVLLFHGGRTRVDLWVFHVLDAHIGARGASDLLWATEPLLAVGLLCIVVLVAVALRRLDVVLLAIAGPVLGVVLSSEILKPLLGRRLGPGVLGNGPMLVTRAGSYPSGHETGVTTTALVLFLVCCQLPWRRWLKATVAAVLLAWIVVAAVALVRNFYHYATDTVGGVGVSLVVVLSLALLIDRSGRRRGQPPQRSRQLQDAGATGHTV